MIIIDNVSISSSISLSTEERESKRPKYKNLYEEVMDLRLEVERQQARYQRVRSELQLFKQAKEQEVENLKARIHYLEQHHFGDKKDNRKNNDKLKPEKDPSDRKRKRGACKGEKRQGKSRRDYSKLEKRTETHDIEESERYCPGCGKEHPEIKNEDIAEVIEIEVKPYIRRIVKKKRRKSFSCGHILANVSDEMPIKETSPDEPSITAAQRPWIAVILRYSHRWFKKNTTPL